MPTYQTPGVYFERADAVVPAITALRTDIAAFVGIAQRGPLHQAVPVQSWRQFESTFGGFIGGGYLAYVVKGFFDNGGRKCYVVRVAASDATQKASGIFKDKRGNASWRIEASSVGVWGNQLAVHLRTTHRAQIRTIIEPHYVDRKSSRVPSLASFERGTLVRLFQGGATPTKPLQVVAKVDREGQRLIWKEPLDAAFMTDSPIFVESIEYTLAVYWRGRLVAIYEDLSLVPEHPSYAPSVVSLPPPERRDARTNILPPPPPLIIVTKVVLPTSLDGLAVDTSTPVLLTGGHDGLATLRVDDFIGEPVAPLDSDQVQTRKRRGLQVLEAVDGVSIVAVPDIHIRPMPPPRITPLPPPESNICVPGPQPPAPPEVPPIAPEQPPTFSYEDVFRVQSAMVTHCEERRDRFALLDAPLGAAKDDRLGAAAIIAWRSRFDSKYAALYYPWLRVVDPLKLGGQVVRVVPPSGHIAGAFARTDIEVGVHKAPANVALQWVEDTTVLMDDAVQAGLNPSGINAIRSFPGRGIRIYGARTVSSDLTWRYVNVRRLVMMIEEALDLSTQWVVFEPNDVYTRNKVRLAITDFLETLWRRGALAGAQPEQAFLVKCDEDNNPPYERDQGRLRADVSIAPSVPYEFIVLRLGRTAEALEITE